jgi:hypothetical protein
MGNGCGQLLNLPRTQYGYANTRFYQKLTNLLSSHQDHIAIKVNIFFTAYRSSVQS